MAVSKEKTFERIKANCKVMPNGCWEWQKFCHPKPRHYGGTGWNGKSWHTHRLTYLLVKGDIPAGMMVVMHSCDNPPCCNPDHLSLGTHLQNMADCRARGRYYYANLTHCKYGHEWLYACGVDLPELIWGPSAGERLDEGFHSSEERRQRRAAGQQPRKRLSRRECIDTPLPFRDLLLSIARSELSQRKAA